MRLAVFTTRYPARGATFFRRDMSALIAAGIEVEVFPIYPLEPGNWSRGADIAADAIPPDRVHNIGIGESLRTPPRRVGRLQRDTIAIGASAARDGAVPFAKSAYVIPKAWAWARRHGERFDHVLAYWGNYAGTCAYVFHRLIDRPIPSRSGCTPGPTCIAPRRSCAGRSRTRTTSSPAASSTGGSCTISTLTPSAPWPGRST
jgi:hypothetical protein